MDQRQIGVVVIVIVASVIGGVGVIAPAAAAQTCSFPYTATDATGTEVTVEAPPNRIVVLGPNVAQTLWEIGGEERVVGMPVNQYTSYLAGSAERENIMNPDGFTINVEKVVNLSPDLAIAPDIVPDETVAKLRTAGITVYRFERERSIADVRDATLRTGRLTGNCDGAEQAVAWMDERLAVVRDAVADEPRPRVIYPLGGGFVAGRETFLHEIIVTAGGRNVAAEAGVVGYQQLSPEVIIARDPEWLLHNDGLPPSAIQMHAYNHTTAIEKDQIIRVNPNYANQPSPRVVIVVETIARALHPAAFASANERATPPPPTTANPARTPTGGAGATAPGQPGFGGLIALIGLAIVTVLGLRRFPP